LEAQVTGCTDPLAINFDPDAVLNDGSCIYQSAAVSPVWSDILPNFLDESSGMMYWNSRLWTHNDDSDINIYSINPDDLSDIVAHPITGTKNIDWEEISQDSAYIYIGDFGNNMGNRTDLKILRIEKTSLLAGVPAIDTIGFRYSLQHELNTSGAHNHDFDCEAFIVENDSIYLFTKEWLSNKASIYSLPKIPGDHIAQFRDSYDMKGLITGSSYLRDERMVVLTGYTSFLQPFLILLYDFAGDDLFGGNKRKVQLNLPFHQVEAIAAVDPLTYYITNEKFSQAGFTVTQKIHKLDLSALLGTYVNTIAHIKPESRIIRAEVFPNPATKIINIVSESDLSGIDYVIIDILGTKIKKGSLNGSHTELEISYLAPGFYLICIDGYYFRRIIKY
jgi:hypothetical protein